MRYFNIVVLLVAFFVSCSGQTNSSTTFKKEIPVWYNGELDPYYQSTQKNATLLKIDSLQDGFDSLQIRIWYDYALLSIGDLLIIKRSNAGWTAISYSLERDLDKPDSIRRLTVEKTDTLKPKNGWDSFLNRLFALQITTLPNMDSIPGLQDDWTDGVTYCVEIATKKQYRFYSYHLPDKFQDKYWQAKNMVDILKLIQTELQVPSGMMQ
jgi:hypothetical protein